ncbi:putative rRNA-processing protein ebp2 [Schizosaccharomyces pombe]|uniref:Probable rRNA-processing protein ebp2 n=1 Tax=Schizosaccharomyces pombe (strain 972 / ATCC 24843) TaxID=284812 RepID=EBP2_SCHPO|nr:putative rRNA processing protein Ebp2 [Schizosaccharomyces pombe]O13802.1 RecName: Full=Probable rRNA-processing protein ebp2 [Schizosaccharomyces pombe 972h-]8ESQ_J Chain J, Probable rRNA-processing protein ebp2 [Schizosaccharomyces pombe]8ESR_J Chain J, Probable rRNA-processing protein ebp2 [Schizosaccharomyces pombe]8ETH_J Chain J, Probable rRNA-processing protein ebp2 [Schizosaccharomyces pombe]8ETI_J Chain J, Probable rRNA-processing protein ebp2 [Schizosaccharomyces pombe]8EUP_J Chai|eukprot:NP_593575.1 putative rRNA processing protein Ebp2 [Schizosaccharomyces pombe]
MAGIESKQRRAQKKAAKAAMKEKKNKESNESSTSVEALNEKEMINTIKSPIIETADTADQENESEGSDEVELSDLEGIELEEDADLIRKRKLAINNTVALENIYERIKYPDDISFVENQAVTTKEPIIIENVEDDLARELAFYKQGVSSVKAAFAKLREANVLISRPHDYFAEMLKSDDHMEKVRQELIKEATAKKLSQQAKKQRELKKFGKQVQLAKQEERQREKKETLEKINLLKRKHTGGDLTTEDDFDIALSSASADTFKKGSRSTKSRPQPNPKRQKKNEKYGFGGPKHRSKSNDLDSLAATEFGRKGLKNIKSKKRPGKARREKARK